MSREPLALALCLLAMLPSVRLVAEDAALAEVGIREKLGEKAALDVTLKDEEGKDVTLGGIVDKPTILTLNYFRCAGICTPLLNGMVDMLAKIALEPGKDFQVVTVSFDPRDTPVIAARKRVNYAKQIDRPFPPHAWRFLTGDGAATKRLADSVGFEFRAQGEDFVHAGAIIMLSPEGQVTRYLYGVSFLPSDVEMAVTEAREGKARPTIAKLLQFCYSYDPAGRRYVFQMTRVIGLFTLLLLGGFALWLLLS